jgi:hypothetical protein
MISDQLSRSIGYNTLREVNAAPTALPMRISRRSAACPTRAVFLLAKTTVEYRSHSVGTAPLRNTDSRRYELSSNAVAIPHYVASAAEHDGVGAT